MNLVILGATGRTGRLAVDQALADGHTVTALVRSPDKLTARNASLRVLAGRAKRRIADRISRGDVAAWLVQAATSPQTSRSSVGITGGTRTKQNVQPEAGSHN